MSQPRVRLTQIASRAQLAVILVATVCSARGLLAQDNTPITVEVEVNENRGGFLGSILSSSRGSLRSSGSEVESRLRSQRWIRLTYSNAEASVTLTDQRRREVGRKENKKDDKVQVEYEYEVRGQLLVGRDRTSLSGEARTTVDSRSSPSDSTHFDTAARELADQAIAELAGHIDELRPDRPLLGFSHREKHRMLVRGDGLEVTDVALGGPAERAGLRVGDRIRRIDDETGTGDMSALVEQAWLLPEGARMLIEVERDKVRHVLEMRPVARSRWVGTDREELGDGDEEKVLRRDRSSESGEGDPGGAQTPARSGVRIIKGMRGAEVL